MKNIARKLIPTPIRRMINALRAKSTYRTHPRFESMDYNSLPVLQCRIAYNANGGYCLPISSIHRPAPQKILNGEVYEPKMIKFLTSQCRGGDIVHAGTFFGDFLPALSRACGPNSKIWAFEPNPESYRCAQITILINGLMNIELTNAGLGDIRGVVQMAVADSSGQSLGGGSTILTSATPERGGTIEHVNIVTIDDTVPADRNVEIIQLDVEGYEKQALIGALSTVQRCLPVLVLETMPDTAWLDKHIFPLGYYIHTTMECNTILLHKHHTV